MDKRVLQPVEIHNILDNLKKTYDFKVDEVIMYTIEHMKNTTCKDSEVFNRKLDDFIECFFEEEGYNTYE